ncbi:MAG: molybdopterin-dependent oxidoreductase, partial [Spirochaetales bacterium]|nr:molybdopterin-dependent oxidoreductase [Spirochaetales bacterium]
MLWGKILRSKVPHGRIIEIDTSEAEKYPGVHVVVTAKDVPGHNGYGIALDDQPVFVTDKVRFVGDAIAGVVAETREIAEAAANKIKVKYEELPGVFDPKEGLKADAPKIHSGGNILQDTHITNGDVEKAFQEADVIVENEYHTTMQMPAYLEVEGGVGVYADGHLTLWCASQYPTQDQRQLAAVMNIPEDKIRIVGNPVGGSFGGKDDLIIQAQLAVMALKAGKPVKIVHSREESCHVGWKRHPMYIYMKTAAKKDGTLLANKVKIVSDTGAYAGLGGPVVNLAVEHACNAYRMPNIDIHGICVYTNNSVCSAMRGFGAPQVTFAMENQMDIIAEKLGMDPLTIRLKNCLRI